MPGERRTAARPPAIPPALLGTACLSVAALSLACGGPGEFRCRDDLACGAAGTCEPTGVCSFADATCLSGRRYGEHAGERHSRKCVDTACPANPVAVLRAGVAHACLVRANGEVGCWGDDTYGQLGRAESAASADATATASDLPRLPRSLVTRVVPLASARARDVAVGERHSCALLEDGTVVCWGANDDGQIGSAGAFNAIPELGRARAIAAGAAFTCALLEDGAVSCWGRNLDRELGAFDGPRTSTPVPIPLPGGASALAARDRHACAVVNGAVFCWGSNHQRELGTGDAEPRSGPALVRDLDGMVVTGLALGVGHSCALADGQIFCWGANTFGQLGDGSNELRPSPVAVPFLSGVATLAAGDHHTCAATADGTTWCWGANAQGQLGEGTTIGINIPVPVVGLRDGEAIAGGGTFTCALRKQGVVVCWGDNRAGQLGTGSAVARFTPSVVFDLANVRAVAAGGAFTCARRPAVAGADTTVCWGANQAGQLGDATRTDRSRAAALGIPLSAAAVAAGALHACLLGGDGSVWCWGRGADGRLGDSAGIDALVPTRVDGLGGVRGIGAGAGHTCALQGAVPVCWGRADEGQLGDGLLTHSRAVPAPVSGETMVVEVALGEAHTCARRSDGAVTCWGRGDEGQLGTGNTSDSATPAVVDFTALSSANAATQAVQISGGARHTCAVLADGTAACWGEGSDGRLGYGSTAPRPIPTAVMGLADLAEIAAGERHTCARARTTGDVWCWGDGRWGQLGASDAEHIRRTPAAEPVMTDALQISAGARHTCALRRDRRVACWGANTSGQLGDGARLSFTTPQPTDLTCP